MAAEHSKDYLSLAQPNTPALQANNANIHSPIDNFARFKETGVFFQIVGMDPCLILLSAPLKWIARVKQSFAKCMEQMANVPLGLKFLRCMHTNLFHFVRTLPLAGEVCIEIPNSLSDCRLQSWTTQRVGGILCLVTQKEARRIYLTSLTSHILHTKIATMFWRVVNITSRHIRAN